MIILIIIIFLIVAVLIFIEEYLGKYKWYPYFCIGVALIIIATFKTVGNDDDSQSYETMFENYDDEFVTISVEYSYVFFSKLLHFISDDVHVIFFLYAVIAILIKMFAIKQLSGKIYISLLVYLSHFFILHDMIEIRASVAAAFFLVSIKPICDGKKWKASLFMLIAFFFHYSAAVLFPLLFFSNKTLEPKTKYILASIVPIGYILYFLHIDLLTTIPIPYISDKLDVYQQLRDLGKFDEILVMKNPILIIKIISFYLLIIFYDTVYEYNKYLPILLKIMGMSLASFFIFSSLPVLSGRLYELYGVVDIIIISSLVYVFKPEYISKAFILLFCFVMFFMDIYVYELIR